jgi:hypothetical protein
MTTKNNKRPSFPNDPYFTPAWLVEQAIKHVVPLVCPVPARIIEPGAGKGAFIRALRQRYYGAAITAIDIEPYQWPEATVSLHADFVTAPLDRYDLAIGNPPFSLALPFVQRCLAVAKSTSLLLRQGFLSSAKRNAFLRMHPPSDVFVVAHRPSFTEDGKADSADYCFVCWGRGNTGTTRLHWLPTVPLPQRK